jgi:hypothetical protein
MDLVTVMKHFVIEVRQIFSYFYNVHALNNVISYSLQPEYHILYMDSFLQSQKHAII